MQLLTEFFNVFNHPNFTLPNVTVNSGAFGTIASTVDVANGNPLGDGGPRIVQFGLKLMFYVSGRLILPHFTSEAVRDGKGVGRPENRIYFTSSGSIFFFSPAP